MNKFSGYIQSAIYNIARNKTYAVFCVLGITIMFVFITIVLQLLNNVLMNSKPFIQADKTIHLSTYIDQYGEKLPGIPPEDISWFLRKLHNYQYCAFHDTQYGNIFVEDSFIGNIATFVNADFWKLNSFSFISGRPFTSEEVIKRLPVAVLTKGFAKRLYNTTNVIGKKLEFQNTIYKIIGVVDNYSNIARNNDLVWFPSSFNQFTPDQSRYFDLYILPNTNVSTSEFKHNIARVVKEYFNNKNINVRLEAKDLNTLREENIQYIGIQTLKYGIPIAVLFLLLIPALNIILLNDSNLRNKGEEIAIRRTIGATISSSFFQIITENLLLVLTGTILGILLTIPTIHMINNILLQGGIYSNISLNPILEWQVIILGIIPISLLFTTISGGIPAFMLARKNIISILKEESEC